MENAKKLVAYFSANSGKTAQLAKTIAETEQADLFEIRPSTPYTEADLDWRDENSRSTLEMKDPESRPEIIGRVDDMESYGTIYLGFPIWWEVAPRVIDTFLDAYDFSGKTIVIFATSGGSDMGKTLDALKPHCNASVTWHDGGVVDFVMTPGQVRTWIDNLK